jgi:hypothetical protein
MKTLTNTIHNYTIKECIRLDQKSKRDQETNSSTPLYDPPPIVWLGSDYCTSCSLQEYYCTCVFEPQAGALPYNNLIDDWIFEAIITKISDEYLAQSGNEQSAAPARTDMVTNMRFSDQEEGFATTIDGTPDPIRSMTDTHDTDLNDFFKRPIKVASYTWAVGTDLDHTINPWVLFFQNKRVTNRMSNFYLMRSDLHVKIVINGNGFYYSRALAMYTPYAAFNDLSSDTDINDLVYQSQRPKIFIDPTTSKGGEIVIPWHWYKDNMTLNSIDLLTIGEMWIRSTAPLQHANAGTEAVDVSVFIWAENLTLSGLTSQNMAGIVPQSGEEIDHANATGTVSGPASAVAACASNLETLPVIGRYAKATSTAAGAVSKVAKALGYSRPPITENPAPRRPTPASSLANTDVPDGVQRLTVDSKQELTIDPMVAGYGRGDLMSIRSIAGRESYLTQFPWTIARAPEDRLFSIRVDPGLANLVGSALVLPACSAAVQPFRYWTGTFKIRFQIVCSSFHRGRLRIVYDPYNHNGADEYNVNYMKIVDLAEETDFTMEVGMSQDSALREHVRPGFDFMGNHYSNVAPLGSSNLGNGILDVHVVNSLAVPSAAPADITVNVYVSMGDDFQVYVPWNKFQHYVFAPQSGFEPQSGYAVPDGSAGTDMPQQDMSEPLAETTKSDPNLALVYVGESVPSFRTLLRRYYKWMAISSLDTIGTTVTVHARAFPFYRGNVPSAIHTTAALAPYNYVNTVMAHWVTCMFAGYRGSIRYKLLPLSPIGDQSWSVERAEGNGTVTSVTTGYIPSVSTVSTTAAARVFDPSDNIASMTGAGGAAYAATPVNPVLEWEMPFYSKFRFSIGPETNETGPTTKDMYRLAGRFKGRDGASTLPDLSEVWTSVGEDFQTYMYVGLGRIYYETAPPAA